MRRDLGRAAVAGVASPREVEPRPLAAASIITGVAAAVAAAAAAVAASVAAVAAAAPEAAAAAAASSPIIVALGSKRRPVALRPVRTVAPEVPPKKALVVGGPLLRPVGDVRLVVRHEVGEVDDRALLGALVLAHLLCGLLLFARSAALILPRRRRLLTALHAAML